MLITVSGMVGSGKSTAVRTVAEICQRAGRESRSVRFRSIGLLGKETSLKAVSKGPGGENRGARWRGFQRRTLTARIALGYAVRVVAFRVFGPRRSGPECLILDRYFYDSFVHYRLETDLERWYVRMLRRLIPVPDVALLLQASADVLAARRPEYALEYMSSAGRGYDDLAGQFPDLVPVRTDLGDGPWRQVESLVRARMKVTPTDGAQRGETR